LSTQEGSNTSNAAIPNAAQLGESRLKQWHQQGEALLTLENLRSWINAAGLVLFAPKPQIVAPAPSLVEAVMGAPTVNPTLQQIAEARKLLARMVAEGLAVPLNLLGTSGTAGSDTPDFICSTAVFSYVFTLRGDKAWKQAPATTGALKVSPLALATHEALAKRGATSVYDLTTELGKEVTEAAVLRALNELWTHLRVLPLTPPDGGPALWELASARFMKQIKAGANAGQPSALSALISLYLGQAVVAAEDEIESFLSPLAARSRIRDVVHALMAARQLETIAVEGRTVLHVAGELPAFLAPESAHVAEGTVAEAEVVATAPPEEADGALGPRITKYVPKPKKIGTGYLAKASPSKFAARPAGAKSFGAKTASLRFGTKSGFTPRTEAGPAPDRERRPFQKPPIDFAGRGFDKPWEEEKKRRLAAAARPSVVDGSEGEFAAASAELESKPRTPRAYKPRESAGKPSFGGKPAFGRKPAVGGKPSFGSKPAFNGEGRPPRREFASPNEGDAGGVRAPRKTFSKPGTFARKREGFGGKPSFGSDSRPPRREFAPRSDRGERGDRPAFGGPRAAGGSSARPRTDRSQRAEGSGGPAARKPYPPRGAGFFSGKPRATDGAARERPERGIATESGKRVYRKFDAPREGAERPARAFSSDRASRPKSAGGFVAKPSGRFAGKPSGGFKSKSGGDFAPRRPSGKPGGFAGKGKAGTSFAGKPGSTFAKFADGQKPFGKRPPARKYKPKGDENA
jgi:hypothetical protein